MKIHCIIFSLSNEKDKDFQPEYQNVQDLACEDCYLLLRTLDEILSCANHTGTDDEQKENVYDVHVSLKLFHGCVI